MNGYEYVKNVNIDLHCHSTNSDGTWSVKQILTTAEMKGVQALAITDHDNLKGSIEAFELKEDYYSGKLVAGIEISTHVDRQKVHLLAYFPTINISHDSELRKNLEKIQNSRVTRMKKMINNANKMGFEVTFEEVLEVASSSLYDKKQPTDVLSRPHLARVFVQKGYVSDIDEAFDRYIGDGKPIHEERFSLGFDEWIQQVNDQNGFLIWAHPLHGHEEDQESLKRVGEILSSSDIAGIERIYRYHEKYQLSQEFENWGKSYLDQLIDDNSWLITAGGDFHGDVGVLGELDLPEENWNKFKSKLYNE